MDTDGQLAPAVGRTDIPEPYLAEWLAWGFNQLATYLRNHAAFEDYYRRRQAATGR